MLRIFNQILKAKNLINLLMELNLWHILRLYLNSNFQFIKSIDE